MIFVAVGGGPFYGFNRLVEEMDRIAKELRDEITIQRGCSIYEPKHARFFDFLPFNKYLEFYKNADIVVGHAGAGTVLLSRIFQKPAIIVPRSHKNGEIFDGHQIEMGKKLLQRPGIKVVFDISKLNDAISEAKASQKKNFERGSGIKNVNTRIKNFLKETNKQ